jgi:hypothetical protein
VRGSAPLLVLSLALAAAAQDGGAAAPPPAVAPPAAPGPAQAAWDAVLGAMTVPGERQPVTSFSISAHVTARQGVQSNDFEATYRFLKPAFIRFGLGPNRETGHGPGQGMKAYWLRDGKQVTLLDSRTYLEDRELVRRMTTIANNILALTDPQKLRTRSLELRASPPELLPEELAFSARRLTWIEFLSPDFDLYRDEPPSGAEPAPERLFRVVVGADKKKNNLPALVLLREEGDPRAVTGEPLLFELQDYRAVDGYKLPHGIKVRGLDTSAPKPVFQSAPAQEISVSFADLTPGFTPDAFLPE